MPSYIAEFYNLPSFLFLLLWVFFPMWLAIRRKQGLVQIGKYNTQGEKEKIGFYFELGIFIFAIPFTAFFLFVTINFIASYFISDQSARFKPSVEISSLIMDIALILYIYLVERKILKDRIQKREGEGDSKQ